MNRSLRFSHEKLQFSSSQVATSPGPHRPLLTVLTVSCGYHFFTVLTVLTVSCRISAAAFTSVQITLSRSLSSPPAVPSRLSV